MSNADKPATREELARLLRWLEWTWNGQAYRCVPCGRRRDDGHADGCELADALRRARLPLLELVPPDPPAQGPA